MDKSLLLVQIDLRETDDSNFMLETSMSIEKSKKGGTTHIREYYTLPQLLGLNLKEGIFKHAIEKAQFLFLETYKKMKMDDKIKKYKKMCR